MRVLRLPRIAAVALAAAFLVGASTISAQGWPEEDQPPEDDVETVIEEVIEETDQVADESAETTPTPTPEPPPVFEPVPAAAFNPAEPFQPSGIYWRPNCGLTSLRFYLRDGAGNYVNGVRVRVETRDTSWGAYSYPTGYPGYGPGETDITLAQDQLAGVWHVWVVDAQNRRISPVVEVETDRNDCRPEGHGHQVGHLQFIDRRVAEPVSASNWDWLAGGILWEPNCSVTQLKLFARGATGQPLNRVRFKVESGNWSTISNPTGIDTNRPGWTDVALRPEAFKNVWRVYVVNDRGEPASEALRVETNDIDCHPEGGGHQVATIVWSKRT